jgi:hypothetical protein
MCEGDIKRPLDATSPLNINEIDVQNEIIN